ncbi:MAG TPA: sigma-70 family RNA polymerase sigma factor, partial [Actinomycetota bacterium]|nr:sigma-70 family RNA polymerase sigma factor [Actinomycetota bacterium]
WEARTVLEEVHIREFLGGPYPKLVTAVAATCGSRAAAEDAVQEALARAWERSLQGYEIRDLEAWVRTVAVNLSRSWLRRRLAERRAGERLRAATRLGGLAPEPSRDRLDVLDALARLPRRQREATVLRYYLDLDVAQIADALGVHEGTVKTTLHRARRALAGLLDEPISREASQR